MKILFFDELDSTNVFLHKKLAEGAEITDTVVVANHQTAGKGMGKNVWESEAGKNLLFSIALNVNFLRAEEQFKISQAVATSIICAISSFNPNPNLDPNLDDDDNDNHSKYLNTYTPKYLNTYKPKHLNTYEPKHLNTLNTSITSIKWPNDIYLGNRKLAGMLIQNTLSGNMMQNTIIGIGLNVNQLEFSKDIPNPISLKMATGIDYDLKSLLNELIVNIKRNIEELRTESGKKLIDEDYKKHLFRYQEWADYEYEGEVKSMIINGYDKYGRLCLTDRNGHEIVCDIKEIKFIL